jgi:hypothetical protein
VRGAEELVMSASSKKSVGWMIVLIMLGMAALYGGSKWLSVLVPAGIVVWFTARPSLKAGRN